MTQGWWAIELIVAFRNKPLAAGAPADKHYEVHHRFLSLVLIISIFSSSLYNSKLPQPELLGYSIAWLFSKTIGGLQHFAKLIHVVTT